MSSSAAKGALLDLRTVKFYDGAALDVPERPGGCPAATVHLSMKTRSDTVNGVEYTYYGESVFGLGDLTGDGHAESVVLVGCWYQSWERHILVVVAATGPTTYATIATQKIDLTVHDLGIRVEDQRIVVYSSHYQYTAANRVGSYVLSADGSLTLGK